MCSAGGRKGACTQGRAHSRYWANSRGWEDKKRGLTEGGKRMKAKEKQGEKITTTIKERAEDDTE